MAPTSAHILAGRPGAKQHSESNGHVVCPAMCRGTAHNGLLSFPKGGTLANGCYPTATIATPHAAVHVEGAM